MRKLLVPWLFFCLSACYSSSHKTGDVGETGNAVEPPADRSA